MRSRYTPRSCGRHSAGIWRRELRAIAFVSPRASSTSGESSTSQRDLEGWAGRGEELLVNETGVAPEIGRLLWRQLRNASVRGSAPAHDSQGLPLQDATRTGGQSLARNTRAAMSTDVETSIVRSSIDRLRTRFRMMLLQPAALAVAIGDLSYTKRRPSDDARPRSRASATDTSRARGHSNQKPMTSATQPGPHSSTTETHLHERGDPCTRHS
jgi:hypothetical protein